MSTQATNTATPSPVNTTAPQVPVNLGQVMATNLLHATFARICPPEWPEEVPHLWLTQCVLRHRSGDWGDLCAEDKESNNVESHDGPNVGRLVSSYLIPIELKIELAAEVDIDLKDEKIYVITDRDRLVTTILFPSEY